VHKTLSKRAVLVTSAVILGLVNPIWPLAQENAPQGGPAGEEWVPPPADAPQPQPDISTLTPRPMWIEMVKEGLYFIRGPLNWCTPGGACSEQWGDDGVVHEPGDVAVRVTDDGVILVDAKFADNVEDVLRLVSSVTDQPVRYVLTTHHHGDHNGGIGEMMERGIEVISQDNLREAYDRVTRREGDSPRVTFGDFGAIYLGNTKVEMHHLVNSHTDGDTVVYFPDLKVVHTGDVVIDGMPHIDYPEGGSAAGWVDAVYDILKLDFDTAIPGHGRLLTKDEVREYAHKMETMNERMKDIVRRGVPKEQAFDELQLEDIGWAGTVSTGTFRQLDVSSYYDEMAAILAAEDTITREAQQ